MFLTLSLFHQVEQTQSDLQLLREEKERREKVVKTLNEKLEKLNNEVCTRIHSTKEGWHEAR